MSTAWSVEPDAAEPSIQNEFVAPWALPGEEIPVLIEWTPHDAFESVHATVPKGFQVIRSLNVVNLIESDSGLEATALSNPGYVGFYLKTIAIPDELITKAPLSVSLVGKGGRLLVRNYQLTIVRPKLEFKAQPTEVVLYDLPRITSPENLPIRIQLRHTGLGVIKLEIQCRFRGELISQKEDVLKAVIKRVVALLPEITRESDEAPNTSEPRAPSEKREVNIDFADGFVEEVKGLVLDNLSGDRLPGEFHDEAELVTVRKMLSEMDYEAFSEIVRDEVYTLYFRRFLEEVRRYPSDYTELRGGPSRVTIDNATRQIDVTISYSDSQGNAYPPLATSIKVDDQRTHRNPLAVPVGVEIETRLLGGLGV